MRRSVANHLNDIAKDHPALVAEWLRDAPARAPPPNAARCCRHASRTLIKRGDARVLKAWGLGRALRRRGARSTLSPKRVALGGDGRTVADACTRRRSARRTLAIDYAVHHVKADGRASAKVFKGWVLSWRPAKRASWSSGTRCGRSPRAATTPAGMPWTCASTARRARRPASELNLESRRPALGVETDATVPSRQSRPAA